MIYKLNEDIVSPQKLDEQAKKKKIFFNDTSKISLTLDRCWRKKMFLSVNNVDQINIG